MIFQNREGTNLNRKRLTIISQTPTEIIADIERADSPTNEGTKIDASVFNAFQASIDAANTNANTALANSTTAINTANQVTSDATSALNAANSANTNATSALTKAITNETNISNAVARIQTLETSKPTFSLSGTVLNITVN